MAGKQAGLTKAEYVLLMALMVVAAIGLFMTFGAHVPK